MITEVVFDQHILFPGLRCKEFVIAGKKVCGRPDVYLRAPAVAMTTITYGQQERPTDRRMAVY